MNSGKPQLVAMALGMFDGVHIGHQKLVECVSERFRIIVATFDRHPLRLIEPQSAPKRLTPNAERIALLHELGVDEVYVQRFDRQLAIKGWKEYLESLVAQFDIGLFVAGENHRFGHGGLGTAEELMRYCSANHIRCMIAPSVQYEGQMVSSTRIRVALEQGCLQEAAYMLGRPYRLIGMVIDGDKIGRRLGFPTINIKPPVDKLIPCNGVYAAIIHYRQKRYAAIVNIGRRPTVIDDGPLHVEAHLLMDAQNWYGKRVKVELYKRIREERHFSTINQLQKQIKSDIELALAYLHELREIDMEG